MVNNIRPLQNSKFTKNQISKTCKCYKQYHKTRQR